MSDNPAFLSRWSRRKQEAREEVEETLPAETPAGTPPEPEKSEAEILAELGLKDPDDMEEGDDFSAFMTAAIPQALRNRALRKLWLTNPALANLDQLLDYGEDFTGKGEVVEKLVTAYRVGKGYVDKAAEKMPGASGESPDAEAENPQEIPALEPSDDKISEKDFGDTGTEPPENRPAVATQPERESRQTSRKRMKFRF